MSKSKSFSDLPVVTAEIASLINKTGTFRQDIKELGVWGAVSGRGDDIENLKPLALVIRWKDMVINNVPVRLFKVLEAIAVNESTNRNVRLKTYLIGGSNWMPVPMWRAKLAASVKCPGAPEIDDLPLYLEAPLKPFDKSGKQLHQSFSVEK